MKEGQPKRYVVRLPARLSEKFDEACLEVCSASKFPVYGIIGALLCRAVEYYLERSPFRENGEELREILKFISKKRSSLG